MDPDSLLVMTPVCVAVTRENMMNLHSANMYCAKYHGIYLCDNTSNTNSGNNGISCNTVFLAMVQ